MLLSILFSSQIFVSILDNPQNSFPNLVGGSGVHRSFSAIPNEPTSFGTNLAASFFAKDPFVDGIKDARTQFRLDGNYTVKWKIPLELFSGMTVSYNEASTPVSSTTMTTAENFDLGVRYGRRAFSDQFFLGAYGYLRFFSGTRAFRTTSGGDDNVRGSAVTGSFGFSETWDLSGELRVPLRQHFNLGYRFPNGNIANARNDFNRFALDSMNSSAIVSAVSFELPYRWMAPFIEYSMEYAVMADTPKPAFGDNRQKLSLGTRITPNPSFGILLAADLGIGGPGTSVATGIPRNPPYELFVGLAFQALGNRVKSEVGTVRGLITDQASGLPLRDVKVTLIGVSIPPVVTNISGNYKFNYLNNGDYEVRFEAPGHESLVKSFSIRKGGDSLLDVVLPVGGYTPSSKTGICAGIVKNVDGKGLVAIFTQVDGEKSSFATDPNTGNFAEKLSEGSHKFKVQAELYLPQEIICNIVKGEKTEIEIVLQKPTEAVIVGDKIILPDAIFFMSGSTDVGQESFKALGQVVDILMKNPNYKMLSIEGHADGEEADELALQRATVIRSYLIGKGIESSKVSATGFGKSRPIATNQIPEGRAENRRVEFHLER